VELGSLLWLLDQTMLAVGGRLLLSWDAQALLLGIFSRPPYHMKLSLVLLQAAGDSAQQ